MRRVERIHWAPGHAVAQGGAAMAAAVFCIRTAIAWPDPVGTIFLAGVGLLMMGLLTVCVRRFAATTAAAVSGDQLIAALRLRMLSIPISAITAVMLERRRPPRGWRRWFGQPFIRLRLEGRRANGHALTLRFDAHAIHGGVPRLARFARTLEQAVGLARHRPDRKAFIGY